MTVTFFFKVTDTGEDLNSLSASHWILTARLVVADVGSWLEIGQSISFFCITSLLLVWSAGICVLGERLMAGTLVEYRVSRAAVRRKGD